MIRNSIKTYIWIEFSPSFSKTLEIFLLEIQMFFFMDSIKAFNDNGNEEVKKDKDNNNNECVKVDVSSKWTTAISLHFKCKI